MQAKTRAFTLAELLIALAILGVIATFSIPKVLQSQQDASYKAIAKEAAGAIAEAYTVYRGQNTPTANTKAIDILQNLNYVKIETTCLFDEIPTGDVADCAAANIRCYRLHNGAILETVDWQEFGGTATTNAIFFYLDPDGKYSGSPTGPGKSVGIFLYFNGRLTNWGNVLPNTNNNTGWGPYNPDPAKDPAWFSWN